MYVSRIVFQVKSDYAKEFELTTQAVANAALAMPGCRAFMMLVNPYNNSQYVLYEEWDTPEQADNFKRSDIRNNSVAKLAPAMAAAPELVEFEAQKRN